MSSPAPLILALLQGAPAPSPAATEPAVVAPAPASAPAPAPASAPATSADPFVAPAPATPAAPGPAPSGIVYYPYSDPAQAPVTEEERKESEAYRKVVFAGILGLNVGVLAEVPSLDGNLFFGTDASPRKSRAGRLWRTAFGYQATLSLGGADETALVLSEIPRAREGQLFFHRHHLTAMGYGARKGRLFYSLGAGVWMNLTSFRGFEAEGRIGVRFGISPNNRGSGIAGLQVRLSAARDGIPVPQFGPFIGFMVF